MIAGLVAGLVLGGCLFFMRQAQPVLLPVLLVLGIAGLSLVVTWQKEREHAADMAWNNELYARLDTPSAAPNEAPLPPPQSAPQPTGAAAGYANGER
jgi:hypothetical protein